VAAWEIAGSAWKRNPYGDARNLPPEADAALALWPDDPGSDYIRSVEAIQLRFDLAESRAHLERALSRGAPAEERILRDYANVLALMGAKSAEIEAAAHDLHRHYPDSARLDPHLTATSEFPERQQAGSLWSGALSRSGRLLVTLQKPGKLEFVDVIVGQTRQESDTRPHRAEVPLGFNPEGTLFATADDDHTVTLWSSPEIAPKVQLRGHVAQVQAIAFAKNGRACATASRDRTVRVWDVATGEPVAILDQYLRPVSAIAFSPDGQLIATGSWNGEIEIWNMFEGTQPQVLAGHRGAITWLAYAPRGGALFSASRDATARLWNDAEAGRILATHRAAIGCALLLNQGGILATGGSDAQVQFWEVTSGKRLHSIDVAGRVFGLGYSAETGSIGVATSTNGVINVVHYAVN
jgi:hypothetical protein